jgi:hypothetical protein
MGLPADPAAFLAAMNEREPARRRTLASAAGDTIVADWLGDGEKGVEYWRFDDSGEVYEHRVFSQSSDVGPVEGPLERLRGAAVLPLSALAHLRRRGR